MNRKSTANASGPIDIHVLTEKHERILAQIKSEEPQNPHVEKYKDKLQELLTAKTNSRDNFINWITGLATGSMFFTLSNLSSTPQGIRIIVLFSAIASFIGIVFAILFKMLLESRFIALELEVEFLRTLYEGHDLQTLLNEKVASGDVPSDAETQRFLRNLDQGLDILDKKTFEERAKSSNLKIRLLACPFWAAIGMFITGVFLMVLRYVYEYVQNCGVFA